MWICVYDYIYNSGRVGVSPPPSLHTSIYVSWLCLCRKMYIVRHYKPQLNWGLYGDIAQCGHHVVLMCLYIEWLYEWWWLCFVCCLGLWLYTYHHYPHPVYISPHYWQHIPLCFYGYIPVMIINTVNNRFILLWFCQPRYRHLRTLLLSYILLYFGIYHL